MTSSSETRRPHNLEHQPPLHHANIILTGFMASGKSTVATALRDISQFELKDTDQMIVDQTGLSIQEISKTFGMTHFRDLESNVCLQLGDISNTIVSTGGGTLMTPRNINILQQLGPIFLLWPTLGTILKRLEYDTERPLNQSIPEITALWHERKETYFNTATHHIHIDTETPQDIALKIWNIYNE